MSSTKRPYRPSPAGVRLRQARIAAGFGEQKELADAAGVGALTINRVERGRGPLSRATAAKVAPFVGRSEAWLLYGAEDAANANEAKTPAVVEQYLTDPAWGKDCSPVVAKLLRDLDYSSIGIANPTLKHVHRAREMIDVNLAFARQRRG